MANNNSNSRAAIDLLYSKANEAKAIEANAKSRSRASTPTGGAEALNVLLSRAGLNPISAADYDALRNANQPAPTISKGVAESYVRSLLADSPEQTKYNQLQSMANRQAALEKEYEELSKGIFFKGPEEINRRNEIKQELSDIQKYINGEYESTLPKAEDEDLKNLAAHRDELKKQIEAIDWQMMGADQAQLFALETRRRQLVTQMEEANNTLADLGSDYADYSFAKRAAYTLSGALKSAAANVGDVGVFANDMRLTGNAYSASPYELLAARASGQGVEDYVKQKQESYLGGKTQEEQAAAYAALDKISESGERDIGRAKSGASELGKFAVDAGVAGTQLAVDAVLSLAVPWLGTASMAVRSFGGAEREARQAGANQAERLLYGGAVAAFETLFKKLFDGVAKVYGGGMFDDVFVEKLAAKMSTSTGQTAVRQLLNILGEGGEEAASAMLQPILQAIYDDGKARKEAYGSPEGLKEHLSNVLYDALIGMALGAAGSGVSIASGQDAAKNAAIAAGLQKPSGAQGQQSNKQTPRKAAESSAEALNELNSAHEQPDAYVRGYDQYGNYIRVDDISRITSDVNDSDAYFDVGMYDANSNARQQSESIEEFIRDPNGEYREGKFTEEDADFILDTPELRAGFETRYGALLPDSSPSARAENISRIMAAAEDGSVITTRTNETDANSALTPDEKAFFAILKAPITTADVMRIYNDPKLAAMFKKFFGALYRNEGIAIWQVEDAARNVDRVKRSIAEERVGKRLGGESKAPNYATDGNYETAKRKVVSNYGNTFGASEQEYLVRERNQRNAAAEFVLNPNGDVREGPMTEEDAAFLLDTTDLRAGFEAVFKPLEPGNSEAARAKNIATIIAASRGELADSNRIMSAEERAAYEQGKARREANKAEREASRAADSKRFMKQNADPEAENEAYWKSYWDTLRKRAEAEYNKELDEFLKENPGATDIPPDNPLSDKQAWINEVTKSLHENSWAARRERETDRAYGNDADELWEQIKDIQANRSMSPQEKLYALTELAPHRNWAVDPVTGEVIDLDAREHGLEIEEVVKGRNKQPSESDILAKAEAEYNAKVAEYFEKNPDKTSLPEDNPLSNKEDWISALVEHYNEAGERNPIYGARALSASGVGDTASGAYRYSRAGGEPKLSNREDPAPGVGERITDEMRETGERIKKERWEENENSRKKKYPIKPPSEDDAPKKKAEKNVSLPEVEELLQEKAERDKIGASNTNGGKPDESKAESKTAEAGSGRTDRAENSGTRKDLADNTGNRNGRRDEAVFAGLSRLKPTLAGRIREDVHRRVPLPEGRKGVNLFDRSVRGHEFKSGTSLVTDYNKLDTELESWLQKQCGYKLRLFTDNLKNGAFARVLHSHREILVSLKSRDYTHSVLHEGLHAKLRESSDTDEPRSAAIKAFDALSGAIGDEEVSALHSAQEAIRQKYYDKLIGKFVKAAKEAGLTDVQISRAMPHYKAEAEKTVVEETVVFIAEGENAKEAIPELAQFTERLRNILIENGTVAPDFFSSLPSMPPKAPKAQTDLGHMEKVIEAKQDADRPPWEEAPKQPAAEEDDIPFTFEEEASDAPSSTSPSPVPPNDPGKKGADEWVSDLDKEEETRATNRERAEETYGSQYEKIEAAGRRITDRELIFNDEKSAPGLSEADKTEAAQSLGKFKAAVKDVITGYSDIDALAEFYRSMQYDKWLAPFYDLEIDNILDKVAKDLKTAIDSPSRDNIMRFQHGASSAIEQLVRKVELKEQAIKNNIQFEKAGRENGNKKNKDGFFVKARNFYNRMQVSAPNMFFMFDGFKNDKGVGYSFGNALKDAAAVETIERVAGNDFFAPIATVKRYKKFFTGQSKTGVKVDGREFSEIEAVSFIKAVDTLVASSKTIFDGPSGQKSKFTGLEGIEIRAGKEKFLYKFDTDKYKSAYEAVMALRSELRNSLSEEAVNYMSAMEKMFAHYSPRLNEASMDAYGKNVHMFKKGKYFPLRFSDGEAEIGDWSLADGLANGYESTGIIKGRKSKSGSYLVIEPCTVVANRYINQASDFIAYSGMASRLTNMNAENPYAPSLSQIAAQNFGPEAGKWMDKFISDISTTNKKLKDDPFSVGLRFLRLNLQNSALGLSPSVPLKQGSAYWEAAGVLRYESLIKAYRPAILKSKHSSDSNYMTKGRRLGGMDQTLNEILNDSQTWVGRLRQSSSLVNNFVNAIGVTDYRVIDNLFRATIIDVAADNPDMNMHSAKFKRLVEAKFEDVVLFTQSNYSKALSSEMQRSDSELVKAVSMFRSQQNQSVNKLVRAFGEYKAAKGSGNEAKAKATLKNAVAGQITSYVHFTIASAIVDGLLHRRDKYEDEEGEITVGSVMERLGLNLVQNAASTLWFGDVAADFLIETLSGGKHNEFYGIPLGPIDTVKDLCNSIGYFWKKPNITNAKRLAGNVGNVFGVPINNVYAMLNAVTMLALDLAGENKDKYDDVFKFLEGKNEAVKRITNGSILDGLIADATGSRSETRTDSYNAVAALYELTGDTSVLPTALKGSFTFGKTDYVLDKRENKKLTDARYEAYYSIIDELISNSAYSNLTDEQKEKLFSAADDYALEVAKREHLDEIGVEYDDGDSSVYDLENAAGYLAAKSVYSLATSDKDGAWDYGALDMLLDDIYPKLSNETKALLDGNNTYAKLDDMYEASKAGIDIKTWKKVSDKFKSLSNDKSINSGDRATMFAMWVDSQGLTSKQTQIIKEQFAFSTGFKVSADSYEDLRAAGLSASSAGALDLAISDLQVLPGHSGILQSQRIEAIVGARYLTEAQKWVVLEFYVSEAAYKNAMKAKANGYTVAQWAAEYTK